MIWATLATATPPPLSPPHLRRRRRWPPGVAYAVPPPVAGLSPRAWSGGAVPATRGGMLRPSAGLGAARVVSVAVARPLGGGVPW
jgi:hypothetical protein